MQTVTDRRQRTAVAFLAEVVAALDGRGRMLSLGQPSQSTASSAASCGTPDHASAGDRLSWSLAWRAGIGW